MKATVNRADLLAAVRRALPAVGKGTSMAVLSGVRLEVKPLGEAGLVHEFNVQCTNLEHQLTTAVELPDDVQQEPGDLIVPADRFAKVIGSMRGDTVTIDAGYDSVAVRAGRTEAALNLLPVADWPRLPDANDGELTTFTAEHLAAIKAVLHAVADDQAKPVFTGVHFAGEHAEATDGYRAVRATLEGLDMPDVIVPGGAVRQIVGVGGIVGMRATPYDALFCTEGGSDWFELRTRLIQGNYPQVRNVLREESPHRLTVDRAEFAASVARVQLLADEVRRIHLSFDGGTLTLASADHGVGEVHDEVTATGSLCECLQLHAGRLAELVANCTGEHVTLETVDAMKYIMVNDGPVTMALVPLRPVTQ